MEFCGEFRGLSSTLGGQHLGRTAPWAASLTSRAFLKEATFWCSWRKEAPLPGNTDKELCRWLLLPLCILPDKEHALFSHPHHSKPSRCRRVRSKTSIQKRPPQTKTITRPLNAVLLLLACRRECIPMVKGNPNKK